MRWLCCIFLAVITALPVLAQVPPPPPEDPPIPSVIGDRVIENITGRTSLTSANRIVNRIGRTYRFMDIGTVSTAGGLFDDFSLALDTSYADVADRALGGDGYDFSTSLYMNGTIGDAFLLGMGLTRGRYRVDGDIDYEQHVDTVDVYGTYALTDELKLGAYLQYYFYDIENALVDDAGIGNTYQRYGGGLLATWRHYEDPWGFGVTTSLASFNKRNLERLFSNNDSAWVTIADIERSITDNLVFDVFVTFYTLLDNESDSDGTYYSAGFDVAYTLTEHSLLSIGFETDIAYADYEENRINATFVYNF